MLLIYPPAAKLCEPPPGVSVLAGHLRENSISCEVVDMNQEAMLDILMHPPQPQGTWEKRACKNVYRHLAHIKEPLLYTKQDSYRRVVADLNKVLDLAGRQKNVLLSLANYQDENLE